MDGRDSIASYYLHRGLGGGIHGAQSIHQNPNPNFGGAHLGGGGGGYHPESSVSMSVNVVESSFGGDGGGGAHGEQAAKRKRGRPRKYGSDGAVAGSLSPLSGPSNANTGPVSGASSGGSGGPHGGKRGRGRPPGTGKNQQLASLGELVACSAGTGFTPHVISIEVGEDVAKKIMSFSQQGPRAVCILSANGAVSTVSLRQPTSFGGTVTYEGRFEILCLSGSYLPTDEGGSHGRSGSLNISLSSPDGRVIGGGVGGLLIAATPVQVIVGSFVYGGSKAKNKSKIDPKQDASGSEYERLPMGNNGNKQVTSISNTISNQTLMMEGGWSGSRQQMDNMRNSTLDIDLTST